MISEESELFIKCIKDEVQKKFGQDISYAKDCQNLSDHIQEITKRQISVSTLKRFYGIIKSPFNPSKFTLDTLTIYLEFENWSEFITSFGKEKHPFSQEGAWEQLRIKALVATEYSMKSLKTKIGTQFKDLSLRKFADKKFNAFLNSPQIATAFIAPSGYGKTTIITQLTEKYFTGPEAEYPNDIVCLIDGGILVNLVTLNPSIKWISNLLDFKPEHSFSRYFRENPQAVKGRFILIIDGLNEIYNDTEKLNHLIENLLKALSSYERIDWFKVVISCRPDNWNIFTSLLQKNPYLKPRWFDVSFEGKMNETINVPLLTEKEIKRILKKNNYAQSFENLKFHYPEIIEIINNPYFLHLFLLLQKPGDIHTVIELLNQFTYNKILSDPYSEDKLRIISSFLRICKLGQGNTSVLKKDFTFLEKHQKSYNEMISDGILYEFRIPGKYLTINTYIKFSHDILFEFFLANKWIEKNELNIELLRKIIVYYKNNSQLQRNILKYIIKFAFKEEKTELLKDIYSIFERKVEKTSTPILNEPYYDIINVIGLELRKNKKVRDILIPWYANSESGQLFYFESFFDYDCLVLHSGDNINLYLENNHSKESMIYGHYMKFLQYLLANDVEECKKEYNIIKNLEIPLNMSPSIASFYFAPQVIWQILFNKELDNNLMDRIFETSKNLFDSGAQTRSSIPFFELVIVYALNFGEKYSEVINLANFIIEKFDQNNFKTSWLYQIFLAFYARALLNTGEIQKGIEVFNQVGFKDIPVNIRYYLSVRYYLVKAEFYIFEEKFKKAKAILEDIKTISHMLKFKFFYDKAVILGDEIYSKSQLPLQKQAQPDQS
jgi:hypothetical protein